MWLQWKMIQLNLVETLQGTITTQSAVRLCRYIARYNASWPACNGGPVVTARGNLGLTEAR